MTIRTWICGLLRRKVVPSKDPTVIRLKAALLDAHRRLASVSSKGATEHVHKAASECLENAKRNADEKEYFIAWDCIHQFDHEMLAAMDDPQRTIRWASLVAECGEKLKGWRIKASEVLIKKVGDAVPVPLPAVWELHTHLWATAQNQQHKIQVYERETLPLLRRLLLGVVATALLFWYFTITADSPSKALIPWAEAILLGVAAGALGGILSMMFSLGRLDASKKIPEARLGTLMTSIRPLLGAAVAIPVVVFVEAKFVDVKGFDRPLSILAFCFLAGFSERWFVGLIEKFESKK